MTTLHSTLPTRFWNHVTVNTETGCWEWNAGLSSTGYGQYGANGKNHGSHRYAYEYLVGPIPPELQVDHLCKVKRCVNPEHMELVTSRENTMRANSASALNARKTRCPQGHPYSPENTYHQHPPSAGPRRVCKTCTLAKGKLRPRRSKKQEAPE